MEQCPPKWDYSYWDYLVDRERPPESVNHIDSYGFELQMWVWALVATPPGEVDFRAQFPEKKGGRHNMNGGWLRNDLDDKLISIDARLGECTLPVDKTEKVEIRLRGWCYLKCYPFTVCLPLAGKVRTCPALRRVYIMVVDYKPGA